MRDLILTLLIPAVLAWGLTSSRRSLYVLTWMCFQRPQDFASNFLAGLPLFQIALVLAVVSHLVRGDFRFRLSGTLALQVLFLLWVTVTTVLAFNAAHAWEFYLGYVPSLLAMPVIYMATIRDLPTLRAVIWIAAGSIALNGTKVGLAYALSGGGIITTQISGFVGDNNVFGLVLCVVVAIVYSLRATLPDKPWMLWALRAALLLNVLCILFTKSRGALLTLLIIGLIAALQSGRAVRNVFALLMACVVLYAALPSSYFDRVETLSDVRADTSAMGRLENWRLSLDEALENPAFGVGPDNHMLYNKAKGTDVVVRVAHSVYFQILGENGFPGLLLYALFLLVSISSIYRCWRLAQSAQTTRPDLRWVRDLSFALFCAFVAYSFGAGLLNMLYIEFPWDMLLLGSMLLPLLREELKKGVQGGEESPAASNVAPGRPAYGVR